jgi:hypothetical protein
MFSWLREEPQFINNGSIKTKVIFKFLRNTIKPYVDDETLKTHFPRNKILNENHPIEVLNYFYNSEEFLFFSKTLDDCIQKIARKHKGFPSATHLTKEIRIEFGNTGLALVRYKENDFHTIEINCNVKYLYPLGMVTGMLTHELYHIIAKFHHGEEVQAENLRKWERKLFNAVLSNKKQIEAWLATAEKELGSGFNVRPHISFEVFYRDVTRIYWNKLVDAGLNIIAMELEDEKYIQYELARSSHLNELNKGPFEALQLIAQKIKSNSALGERKKKFYISYLCLLEFISCYTEMPYNIVPYASIDDYWHPKKKFFFVFKERNYHNTAKEQIKIFEAQILKYFEPEAATAFLKFWNFYKKIVKHMNIWTDPLNPDITGKIHNVESLHSAREGIKLLNRLFNQLFKGVKKYE